MLERRVEQRLVERAREAGGLAIKWVAPAFSGVPDRIIFLPGGRIFFVELKAPGKTTTALQDRIIGILRSLGAEVHVIDSLEGCDALFP